jgi:hypothetical protein
VLAATPNAGGRRASEVRAQFGPQHKYTLGRRIYSIEQEERSYYCYYNRE